jgi:hypothetical protein
MMPPLIDPSSPDFTLVRRTVEKRIATSEAIDRPTAKPTPATAPNATAKPKPKASSSKNAQTDSSKNAQTDDLGKVCAA